MLLLRPLVSCCYSAATHGAVARWQVLCWLASEINKGMKQFLSLSYQVGGQADALHSVPGTCKVPEGQISHRRTHMDSKSQPAFPRAQNFMRGCKNPKALGTAPALRPHNQSPPQSPSMLGAPKWRQLQTAVKTDKGKGPRAMSSR